MVGGSRAAVAADEAECRAAVTLAGEELEVADDHAEVVEIPVQRLGVCSALQHDVTEANAMPRKRVVAPRRMITHGAPGSVPRSWSSVSVRSTVVKPKACANASA